MTKQADDARDGAFGESFAVPSSTPMSTLSIVIPNFNYGAFVSDSVRSALAVDWPDVEVIVVDDGSTDNSLEVLRSFGDRITVISQENAGPRVACNRGFAASRGDAVIFLDSDDVLEPTIARDVAVEWRVGVSKVQVQMCRIDRDGRAISRPFPAYRRVPSPEQIRYWIRATSAYPTPPGSGNVYARSFLERLFPLDDRCGDATDSACLAAAPFLGDVVTIPRALVRYRVHGGNRSSLLASPDRFRRQIERAHQRQGLAMELAGDACEDEVIAALRRGRHLLQMRVAERRLCGGEAPIPGDSRLRIAWDAVRSVAAPGPESLLQRLAVSAWCLAGLFGPQLVLQRLVTWRFT
ncbi:glycosyltransferase [Actinomycetospora rhizophila]|uniref:Glycosyltransferase n=1 Tax=Actinomycetospora rhizophila TaxID=1416876 RepID=A0ABV9ZRA0_9PSEU